MTHFSTRRANERDIATLDRLCIEASGSRGSLCSSRSDRFRPAAWIAARAPLVVVAEGTNVVGFATALSENVPLGVPRCAEAAVYVTPDHRLRGAGRAAMSELMSAARSTGLWKVIAYALPQDPATRALLERLDFREVGVLVKHVQIEGAWHDVVLCERLVLAARKSLPSFHDG